MRFKKFTLYYLLALGFIMSATQAYAQNIVPYAAIEFESDKYPPGYTKESDYPNTCFDFMGAVDFSSSYRWITSYTGSTPPAGWSDGKINPEGPKLVGFTTPAVVDLDLDGYPEVIGLSAHTDADGAARTNGIEIFNGQTGKSISRLLFGTAEGQYYTTETWHPSPSMVSYADVDKDGIVEAVFAFPTTYAGLSPANSYPGRVVAYKVTPQKNAEGITTSYTLNFMWQSSTQYNDGNASYNKGLPQIVDIDGDGVTEVVVYNKVYNGLNGVELLNFEGSITTANTGILLNSYNVGDQQMNFSYVYDVDLDSIYDVAAGGKVYQITKTGDTWGYNLIQMAGVPDGRTGVADINGDRIPDIVTYSKPNAANIRLVAWNADTHILDGNEDVIENPNTPVPYIIADITFRAPNEGYGTASHLFIGDIDGKVQLSNGKYYIVPEVAILTGLNNRTTANRNGFAAIPRHPNAAGEIPNAYPTSPSTYGAILGFSFDAEATTNTDAFKLSFVLEHLDQSQSTGFVMFDFANDGLQEICYRDEKTLRIIKASKAYIPLDENDPNVILFSRPVLSRTGFEWPVIADIDNDASAEMVVMGVHQDYVFYSYLYALGTNGDKFAPALPVWNQALYDPFKIDPYTLQTPKRKAYNRLDKQYTYSRIIRDADGNVLGVYEYFNPYNGTLLQVPRYRLVEMEHNGTTFDNVLQPIVFLTESYIVDENSDEVDKRPVIEGDTIRIYIGNRATAETDISVNTPIRIYMDSIEDATGQRKFIETNLHDCRITTPIKAGDEARAAIDISSISPGGFGFFIVRIGDSSIGLDTATPTWRFGANNADDLPGSPVTEGLGICRRAYRDCYWGDQTAKVSKFMLFDDASTVQAFDTITVDVLVNDIYPDAYTPVLNDAAIKTKPKAGTLSFKGTGADARVIYKHTGKEELTDGIDRFTYQLSYTDQASGETVTDSAHVYVYVLQNTSGKLATCYGGDITIELKELPAATEFWWSSDRVGSDTIPEPGTISNVTAPQTFFVRPQVKAAPYDAFIFPYARLVVQPIGDNSTDVNMKWTGAVNTDWNNPNNWLVVDGFAETQATFAPAKCTNIEIPGGKVNYPFLSAPSEAGFIIIKDRAMIANTHKLDYDSAGVEINFDPIKERNRWVMYSAPLRKVYSGDYMLLDSNNDPIVKPDPAVYMSFFQADNPDRPEMVATAKAFTKPFGNVGVPLPLGKSFNVWIDADVDTSTPFRFPSMYEEYDYWVHGPWGGDTGDSTSQKLDRTVETSPGVFKKVNGRFIVEDAMVATDGSFTLTPPDDKAGFSLIMLPNPFMAYMDMNQFLDDNTNVLNKEYKIWSGKDDAFISYKLVPGFDYQYWWVSDGAQLDDLNNNQYVSPLQSFIVSKKDAVVNTLVNVDYNPETITSTEQRNSGDYEIRKLRQETEGVLKVTASIANLNNSTLLVNSPEATNQFDEFDAIKLFYDKIYVEDNGDTLDLPHILIYTLTEDMKTPMAINAANRFKNLEVPLGMRLSVQGNIRFDFSGVENFGVQPMYFMDGTNRIDISVNPSYSTTITGGNKFREINDRFKIVFPDNTVGDGSEQYSNLINIWAENGRINISSRDLMERIEVTSASGSMVYKSETPTLSQVIDIQAQQVYVVRVKTDKQTAIRKVVVK